MEILNIFFRSFDSKDGMHYQFIFCAGVFLVAAFLAFMFPHNKAHEIVDGTMIEEKEFLPTLQVEIHLDGCFVGLLWCLGNAMTPAIVKRLGLGVGVSLWSGKESYLENVSMST